MNLALPKGSVKKALRYALLPGILPRLRSLGLGFPFLAYQMATILAQFGLLPRFHAYLNPANIGLYSIRQVMVEAARNLRPGFADIDQKIIFFLFLTIFAILVIQFLAVFSMLGISAANAAGFTSMFISPNPDFDLALVTLDRVFGVPNIFGSCISTSIDCKIMWPNGTPESSAFPSSFHTAFHKLLSFYSQAMLLVGVVILVYYFFAMMGETAQTGSPFGQRFDSIYAPLRLILCVALLLPINYGLNVGQHITLHIANWGSGLASNGWKVFNAGLANALDLESKQMVAKPELKDMSNIVRFMLIAQTCRAGYKEQDQKDIKPYLVRGISNEDATATSYDGARKFYEDSDVLIRFGWKDATNFTSFRGRVAPVCGDIVIRSNDINQEGSAIIYEYFYNTVLAMWNSANLQNAGKAIYYAYDDTEKTDPQSAIGGLVGWGLDPFKPDSAFFMQIRDDWQATFEGVLAAARASLIGSKAFVVDPNIGKLGWAGAGIWFNKIAEKNGAFLSAAANIPEVVAFPSIMEDIKRIHLANDGTNIDEANPYSLTLKNGNVISFRDATKKPIATSLVNAWEMIVSNKPMNSKQASGNETGNIITDTIAMVFGAQGLFNIRNNSDIHPFAQIVALGRSLIDHTIIFLAGGVATAALEGLASKFATKSMLSSGVLSSFMFSIAAIGLSAGFFMYYIIPLLPFMYFFFGLMKWIVIVFEAVVCVPVWALAHLRIDGEGLMGDPATTGYGQLLEVLLRPVMTIFGLLAAITIFSALVVTLNSIFDLVTSNLTGFTNKDTSGKFTLLGVESYRGLLDQFAFTIIYVILVYMIGISSFKLIDTIPAQIFRWMDMDVKNIADNLTSAEKLLENQAAAAVYMGSSRLITGRTGIPGTDKLIADTAGLDDVSRSFGQGLGGLLGGGGKKP